MASKRAGLVEKVRDPRKDPVKGDILRVGGTYGTYIEVTEDNLCYGDVRIAKDGKESLISQHPYMELVKSAEVIRKVRINGSSKVS